LNSIEELGVGALVRKPGSRNLPVAQLGVGVKKDEEMGVRQATLLKLDNVDVRNRTSQNILLHKQVYHCGKLEPEYADNPVRPVAELLASRSATLNSGQSGLQAIVRKRCGFPKAHTTAMASCEAPC